MSHPQANEERVAVLAAREQATREYLSMSQMWQDFVDRKKAGRRRAPQARGGSTRAGAEALPRTLDDDELTVHEREVREFVPPITRAVRDGDIQHRSAAEWPPAQPPADKRVLRQPTRARERSGASSQRSARSW